MDEELVYQAQQGDQEALAQLLYKNYDVVYKTLIKFTLNATLAEDLAQEAMVRAIEKIHLYQPQKSKFSSWLITIAQNIYIDSLRKGKSEQKYTAGQAHTMELGEPPNEDWSQVLEALAHLPEDSRLPVILKHYYGYSYEEIAIRMKINIGTVKSRIHNTLKLLKKEMEFYG
jgi:RNA polymerase sigma-70 factor, ECF subfamily